MVLVSTFSCLINCYLLLRERILEYRDESQRLDQCSRLYDSSVSNDGFELDAGHIVQVLSLCSCCLSVIYSIFVKYDFFFSFQVKRFFLGGRIELAVKWQSPYKKRGKKGWIDVSS